MNGNETVKTGMDKINSFLCVIFLFNVVFLPADNFDLKIISLFLLLALNIPKIIKGMNGPILLFGFVLTSVTIVWSIILTGNLSNIRLGYMGYILLLYPIIKEKKIGFYDTFIKALDFLAIFSVAMWLLDLLQIIPINNNALLMWFHTSNNAMIGKGSHIIIGVSLFFKTSPLLFFALADRLNKKKYLLSVIISMAIFLTATRANILCLVAVIAVYLVFFCPNKNLRIISVIIGMVAAMYFLIDGSVINLIKEMFEKKAGGDLVRDGHLKGILEVFGNNPEKLFFGSGFSSEFYSYGLNAMVQNVELSYWNLLRQVGLFLFIPMMIMYIYPLLKLRKDKNNYMLMLAYFVYLVIAYTNPFLYSTTGMTLVLMMYYISLNRIKTVSQ